MGGARARRMRHRWNARCLAVANLSDLRLNPVRIALFAGEASGDILGSGLIRSLRARFPHAEFEGIAGPLMQAEGCNSL